MGQWRTTLSKLTPQSFKPITTPGTEITVLSQWLNNFLKVYFHLLASGYWVVYYVKATKINFILQTVYEDDNFCFDKNYTEIGHPFSCPPLHLLVPSHSFSHTLISFPVYSVYYLISVPTTPPP